MRGLCVSILLCLNVVLQAYPTFAAHTAFAARNIDNLPRPIKPYQLHPRNIVHLGMNLVPRGRKPESPASKPTPPRGRAQQSQQQQRQSSGNEPPQRALTVQTSRPGGAESPSVPGGSGSAQATPRRSSERMRPLSAPVSPGAFQPLTAAVHRALGPSGALGQGRGRGYGPTPQGSQPGTAFPPSSPNFRPPPPSEPAALNGRPPSVESLSPLSSVSSLGSSGFEFARPHRPNEQQEQE